ncbi:hypothetical protein S7335_3859 [Synechococcus sp. PCC 7335]|nr:hypothetical protein S7335_3859 [Synechococcus sp. PCC 7335]
MHQGFPALENVWSQVAKAIVWLMSGHKQIKASATAQISQQSSTLQAS